MDSLALMNNEVKHYVDLLLCYLCTIVCDFIIKLK